MSNNERRTRNIEVRRVRRREGWDGDGEWDVSHESQKRHKTEGGTTITAEDGCATKKVQN
ncbi:MAG: hypothetical protein NTW55_01085 [Planctomycetota bacterium]|nr:hypothetical protein [Planctomycetota bacterium]